MTSELKGLKVVLVGPIPPPAGGMANQTRKLRAFLEQEQAECRMVATNAPYKPAWAEKLKGVRALFRLIPYLFSLNRACKGADVMHIMANSGWSWHLFAAPAIVIARMNRLAVVVNYRGGYAREFFEKSWGWVNRTLRHAQQVIVPSPFLQDVFADWQVEAGVVPNVLDTERFHFAPKTVVSDAPRFLVARNLEDIYDVASAIKAFAIVQRTFPNSTLFVAGSGPQAEMLKGLSKELGIDDSVTFTGRLSADEMAEHYRLADVSINPSKVDNTPNSIIESLASGTPAVSTNVGGIPRLVTHEHDALMGEPEQPEALAELVLRVIADDDLRNKLIHNGQQTIQKFRWPNVRAVLAERYHAAIDINGRAQ